MTHAFVVEGTSAACGGPALADVRDFDGRIATVDAVGPARTVAPFVVRWTGSRHG